MKKFTVLLIAVLAATLVACGSSEPETVEVPVEVTRQVVTEATVEVVVTEVVEVETVVTENVEVVRLPSVDPLSVSGDIIQAGSSTVFPLAEAVAERFIDEGYGGNITIDSIGSGAGFSRFCEAGETDISNASRPIKDSEVESCQEIGRDPIEFRVGTDALAVVVSSDNDFLNDVTFEELQQIFSTASNWSDVRSEWPAEPIQLFIPGTDSGTFDYFVEEVFDEDPEPMLTADPQMSEDDNVLVQGISASPYAIGFFGYAYFQENEDILQAIAIEGVEPSAESVDSNTYPLARPLFIYGDAGVMANKPQVNAFVSYFLNNVNEVINEVGYFPASTDALNDAKNKWLTANQMEVAVPQAGITLPIVDPLSVTGDIIEAGSSTVFPLAEAVAERFIDEGYGGNITIDSIGSGAGFSRFCEAGETDISNASRPIRDSEVESCQEIGRDPIEFRVGTDALAVVVSSDNDFVDDVTIEELQQIFSTASNWSDVRSDWPDEAIQLFIPGTDSGTFDYFVEEVFEEDPAPMLNADPQMSEDDNVLVQGISASPYAIGFFGYAYFQENADILQAISIEGVEPSAEAVESNTYVLARPLFIYGDCGIMQEKPQVNDFINYFLTNVNEVILEVGYFPASDDALNQAKVSWLNCNN